MTAKQLSVFIENRKGRLSEVLDVLKENGVSIISLSLADTTEYGLLRLIVNNPEQGREQLAKAGFSTLLSDVLIIKIPHVAGSLQAILKKIEKEDINVEYLYGLSIESEQAYVVLKASDAQRTSKVLEENGIETLLPDQIAKL
ncbi:MAG: ACT domain-containing protein [Clostridiales bacterium]|nr:ACT domain-containing protein [Clostridiales bacterium]